MELSNGIRTKTGVGKISAHSPDLISPIHIRFRFEQCFQTSQWHELDDLLTLMAKRTGRGWRRTNMKTEGRMNGRMNGGSLRAVQRTFRRSTSAFSERSFSNTSHQPWEAALVKTNPGANCTDPHDQGREKKHRGVDQSTVRTMGWKKQLSHERIRLRKTEFIPKNHDQKGKQKQKQEHKTRRHPFFGGWKASDGRQHHSSSRGEGEMMDRRDATEIPTSREEWKGKDLD